MATKKRIRKPGPLKAPGRSYPLAKILQCGNLIVTIDNMIWSVDMPRFIAWLTRVHEWQRSKKLG